VVLDGVGLNITVMSYRDSIDVGIVCDRDQIEDAWPLLESMERSLEELCEVICGAKRPPARASTAS
jgi:hypothetical protein